MHCCVQISPSPHLPAAAAHGQSFLRCGAGPAGHSKGTCLEADGNTANSSVRQTSVNYPTAAVGFFQLNLLWLQCPMDRECSAAGWHSPGHRAARRCFNLPFLPADHSTSEKQAWAKAVLPFVCSGITKQARTGSLNVTELQWFPRSPCTVKFGYIL